MQRKRILEILEKDISKKSVLDLCTGSGAIGISIAKYSESHVTMSDISENALNIFGFFPDIAIT